MATADNIDEEIHPDYSSSDVPAEPPTNPPDPTPGRRAVGGQGEGSRVVRPNQGCIGWIMACHGVSKHFKIFFFKMVL